MTVLEYILNRLNQKFSSICGAGSCFWDIVWILYLAFCLLRGCLHEKIRAHTSFILGWLFDFVSHLHDDCRDSNPPDLIGSLPIWCLASRSPDFYQILPIYCKILKTRGKLLIFRIFGDLSLWNTHIILTFFAKSIMVCYNSGRNDVKIQEMALERT